MVENVKKIIRAAFHAGSWYSKEGSVLSSELQTFLDAASKTVPEKDGYILKAIIGPHAGYRYSGPTAAWAYKNIDPSKYDRVILLGPSHKVALDFIATTTCTEWETPLGNIDIDREAVQDLLEVKDGQLFGMIDVKYEENEHSLEMHIPYIRKVFTGKQIKLVPLMVGHVPKERMSDCGKALQKYFLDERTLFVVSSDFCHWGKRFRYTHKFEDASTISESIEQLDKMGMEMIEKQELKAFQSYLDKYSNTICGRLPIQVLLATIEEAAKSKHEIETKFVKYAQSGKIVDDYDDSSVSYASSYTLFKKV